VTRRLPAVDGQSYREGETERLISTADGKTTKTVLVTCRGSSGLA
jgi:hypothetical protein